MFEFFDKLGIPPGAGPTTRLLRGHERTTQTLALRNTRVREGKVKRTHEWRWETVCYLRVAKVHTHVHTHTSQREREREGYTTQHTRNERRKTKQTPKEAEQVEGHIHTNIGVRKLGQSPHRCHVSLLLKTQDHWPITEPVKTRGHAWRYQRHFVICVTCVPQRLCPRKFSPYIHTRPGQKYGIPTAYRRAAPPEQS